MWTRPLYFDMNSGGHCEVLRVRRGGVLGPPPASEPGARLRAQGPLALPRALVGARTTGSYVFETPGEVHTLTVDDDDEMQTFFYVGGPTLYVDENDQVTVVEDNFQLIELAREHYAQGRAGRGLRQPVHPLTARSERAARTVTACALRRIPRSSSPAPPTGWGARSPSGWPALGATVLLHGRDPDRAGGDGGRHRASRTGTERLQTFRADLASLAQVRGARGRRCEAAVGELHVLRGERRHRRRRAGRRATRQTSRDGHELRFAVNHLAAAA